MWVDYRFGLSGKSEVQTLMDSASNLMAIQGVEGSDNQTQGHDWFYQPRAWAMISRCAIDA